MEYTVRERRIHWMDWLGPEKYGGGNSNDKDNSQESIA